MRSIRATGMSALPRRAWMGAAFLALSLAPAPAGAQAPFSEAAPAAAARPEDVLFPGDVVRLRVWREPDLSGDFGVDQNGVVVLPRLGPTTVRGVAGDELRARIVRGYTAFLNHASVEVTLLHRVQVLGAVRTPGLYPVDATMTLGDVLALAGGTTPQGRPDRVLLVRRATGERIAVAARTPVSETPLGSGDQLYVPERSWLSRNPGVVSAGLAAVVGLIATLSR
jgi:protein involved in polysaccharide export with SLBB domain